MLLNELGNSIIMVYIYIYILEIPGISTIIVYSTHPYTHNTKCDFHSGMVKKHQFMVMTGGWFIIV